MDDSGYSSSSNTLAGELAVRLSRQIDLIAASASASGSGSGSSSLVKRGSDGGDDNDVDEDEEEDYEEVDAEGRVPSAGSNDSNSDSVSTTSEEAAISLQSNPSMLSLQASLARIRSSLMPGSYSKLKESIEQAWKSEMELQHAQTIVSAASTSSSSDVSDSVADNLVWTVNAHLTASSYCAVLESLLNDAEKVKQEELYWQSIESRDRYSTMYLVQSGFPSFARIDCCILINVYTTAMPKRIARSLRVLLDRLQYLASSPRPPSHLLSYPAIKRALPPSLLLTSLFPHLSASHSSSASLSSPSALNTPVSNKHSPNRHRSLLFLTLSPLLLTRQEVSLKRRELKKLRLELADKIGGLVRDAERGFEELSSLHTQNTKVDKLRSLGGIMGQRIAYLEDVTRRGSEEAGNKVEQDPTAYEPRAPNELLLSLQQTVHKPILAHAELVHSRIQALSRPSRLTRAWPWLITVPLGSYILVTQLYNSRMTIYNYYSYAKETFIGFMMDWLIEPTKKIFETLRHSDDGLSIMSKESLKSDFDSLERMVVQFAKDQQGPNLSQVELEDIGRNVRQGDLSIVLGAYEQDLKVSTSHVITTECETDDSSLSITFRFIVTS